MRSHSRVGWSWDQSPSLGSCLVEQCLVSLEPLPPTSEPLRKTTQPLTSFMPESVPWSSPAFVTVTVVRPARLLSLLPSMHTKRELNRSPLEVLPLP